jgi:hypothetical protein
LWAGVVITVAVAAGFCAVFFFDTTGQKGSGLPAEYVYDISQYAKIDPALILYRQAEPAIVTGLKSAKAIAVRDDIYIAGDKDIVVMDKAGGVKRKIALDAEPTSLAVKDEGVIVAGLGDTLAIINTDSKGKQLRWKVGGAKARLTSIVLSAEMIFAADAVNGLIYEYDWMGKLIRTIGGGVGENKFVIPSPYFDIAMAPDGLLRVVDPGRHLIVAYTVNGDREWVWGAATPAIEGFSGCCNPVNFAMLADGSFVMAEKGLVRVKIYDAEGKFIGVVAGPQQLEWTEQQVCTSPEQCQSKGFDVAVDAAGRIYVLDTVKNAVRIFEKK